MVWQHLVYAQIVKTNQTTGYFCTKIYKMKVAVVGATGMVGSVMIKLLEERDFPVTEFIPVASEKSKGKSLTFKGKTCNIVTPDEAIAMKPHLALFSAGAGTSLHYAPLFAQVNTVVIDNSSAWRMQPQIKLVVPEINGIEITSSDKIIANPNCSTIQMVMALNPLYLKYGIKRIVVSTYQSVSGTGVKAVEQLFGERNNQEVDKAYAYTIDLNIIPHIDSFLDNGYTKEEMKMVNETRKILNAPHIALTATTVRVPVVGGHSEAVNVEFDKEYNLEEVRGLLSITQGITVIDDVKNLQYPMPLVHAHGSDEVFVGRLRRDESQAKTLNMWIVSDNLRKGAATNAIQIAELMIRNRLL